MVFVGAPRSTLAVLVLCAAAPASGRSDPVEQEIRAIFREAFAKPREMEAGGAQASLPEQKAGKKTGCASIPGSGPYKDRTLRECRYQYDDAHRIVREDDDDDDAKYTRAEEGSTWFGRVRLLNAPHDVLAVWALHACRQAVDAAPIKHEKPAAKAKRTVDCGNGIASYVRGQSGAQFPVAGIVIETDTAGGGKVDGAHVSFFFKDGVTIATAKSKAWAKTPQDTGKSFPGRDLTQAELEEALADLALDNPAGAEAKKHARVGGLSAKCYQQAAKPEKPVYVKEPKDNEGHATLRWLTVSRDSYLSALGEPALGRPAQHYEMFDILARNLDYDEKGNLGLPETCK